MFRSVVLPAAVVAVLALEGCSSVTTPTSHTLVGTDKDNGRISPARAQKDRLLKRKVAIVRFADETRHGTASALSQDNDGVGKQAMDILSSRLSGTGKFLILERADFGKIRSGQTFSDAQRNQIGADYLLVGAISEFGRSVEREVGLFSSKPIQAARAKVNVQLIEVRTGQIIYTNEGSGEAIAEVDAVSATKHGTAYDASLDNKAISAAISQLISSLVSNLTDLPWRAYVVGEENGLYILTGGQAQGLAIGDELRLMKPGPQVMNPQTGMLLELPGKPVGYVRIEGFARQGDNEISLASLVSGRIEAKNMSSFYVISERSGS